jgi:hypothetical protein
VRGGAATSSGQRTGIMAQATVDLGAGPAIPIVDFAVLLQ